jgi:hypothetical protein
MKNNMSLIMESWRASQILSESIVDLIKNKKIDEETIEAIGEKLSDNEGFELAISFFNSLSEFDQEEIEELDESALDWMNQKIVQGLIAKDNLIDVLKNDSRFAPMLKLSGPALGLAFLYYKSQSGGVDPEDFATATNMIAKKGNISLEDAADAVLMEKRKKNG